MGIALITLGFLSLALGAILAYAARKFHVETEAVVDEIDALLPQTQCGQCSFPGCRPYAEAIARGLADINQCPPGGQTTIDALATLLGSEGKALNAENGIEGPSRFAVIDEDECIGCTLCLQACPVDAIVGASKLMHTVIVSACTGCDLCLPPCPEDCITMVEHPVTLDTWSWSAPKSPALGAGTETQ